jgi:hypothetical protein
MKSTSLVLIGAMFGLTHSVLAEPIPAGAQLVVRSDRP